MKKMESAGALVALIAALGGVAVVRIVAPGAFQVLQPEAWIVPRRNSCKTWLYREGPSRTLGNTLVCILNFPN